MSNSTDEVAQDQLRAFVSRVERLEEEIKALNEDKADVYAEAKSNGFDVKVLKRVIAERRRDPSERSEAETIFELYWQAVKRHSKLTPDRRAILTPLAGKGLRSGPLIAQP